MTDVPPLTAGATVTGDSSRPFVFPIGIHICDLEDCPGLLMKPAVCFFWGTTRVIEWGTVWTCGAGSGVVLSYVAA